MSHKLECQREVPLLNALSLECIHLILFEYGIIQ